MSDLEKWRIEAWGLSDGCYEATCSRCGWQYVPGERTQEQAIARLKQLGWQLRGTGPICPECALQEELDDPTTISSK